MEIFTFNWGDKGKGDVFLFSCTNKRVRADRAGIGYDKLVKIFTREKRNYYEVPEKELNIIRLKILHKGGQRIKVRKSSTIYNRNI